MRRLISSVVLAAFAGGALLSLMLMGAAVHDGVGKFGCPLMPLQATVCTMTALDHVAAWQAMFTAIPQGMILLILAVLICVAWRSLVPAIEQSRGAPARFAREPYHAFPAFQELFSSGILHPKLH